jgi:hypothetical protein
MRERSMVMNPERLGPASDCIANYRPALSSKRELHFSNQIIIRLKKRKGKIWSWAPKEGPTPVQTGRLIVGRNINVDDDKDVVLACAGRLEYLQRSSASRKWRQRGNSVVSNGTVGCSHEFCGTWTKSDSELYE